MIGIVGFCDNIWSICDVMWCGGWFVGWVLSCKVGELKLYS